MNRYLLAIELLVQVDDPTGSRQDVAADFYSRLSELVQSEDHMLGATVEAYLLPGSKALADEGP